MKYLLTIFVISVAIINKSPAQIVRLIPTTQPIQNGSVQVPNYGSLLISFQEGLKALADINCQQTLNEQLAAKIESARSTVKKQTRYVVIAEITNKMDCKISTFRQAYHPYETPSVIHSPETQFLVYTLEVYPWIIVNGVKY